MTVVSAPKWPMLAPIVPQESTSVSGSLPVHPFTSSVNLPFRANNSWGSPNSTTIPLSMTATTSEAKIVSMLCAIVTTVQLEQFSLRTFRTTASVSLSILPVGSSKSRTLRPCLTSRRARASASSCCWPLDSDDGVMSASRPPSRSASTPLQRPTQDRASTIASSVARHRGSTFKRTLPTMMKASCGRATKRERMVSRGRVERSSPSTIMEPCSISNSRSRVPTSELLPLSRGCVRLFIERIVLGAVTYLPVRPQRPNLWPGAMEKLTSRSATVSGLEAN